MLFPSKSITALAAAALLPLAHSVSAGQINDNIKYSGRLRTVDIHADRKGKDNAGAWTASALFNIEASLADGLLGAGASWYGAAAIDDGDTKNPKNLLIYGSKKGISKLGQAYIKSKISDDDFSATVKAGRTRIYRGLISGSNSRSIPSAWQGIDGEIKYGALKAGAAWVNKSLPRDTAGARHMETASGQRIDHIIGSEIGYKAPNDLQLKYLNGFAKDFVKGQKLTVSKGFKVGDDEKITLNAVYFESRKNGNLWTGVGGWKGNGFKTKAQTYDFNIKYTFDNAYVRAGYAHTKADSYLKGKDYQTARHYYDFGKNSYGVWYSWSNTGLVEEFYWDGERVLALGAGYNFQEILPGLKIDYKFRKGNDIAVVSPKTGKKAKTASESEHNIDLRYSFAAVKGLSTRLRYGVYKQSHVPRETNEHQLRAYLDYAF